MKLFINFLFFLNPIDIIHYCSTNPKNRFYKKNCIIWKKLFMRDYYYQELNLMGYANIFFVRDHEVNCIDGPKRGWINQYKYCHIRHMIITNLKNEYLLQQLHKLY